MNINAPRPNPEREAAPTETTPPRTTDLTNLVGEELTDETIDQQSQIPAGETQQRIIVRSRSLLASRIGKERITDQDLASIREEIGKYRTTLGNRSIQDIRSHSRLLSPAGENETAEQKIEGLKTETAQRLLAYTREFEEGHTSGYFEENPESWQDKWFTLDYQSVGQGHEISIGLGEILLDPDIDKILIQKDGEIIEATRGKATSPPRHAGRQGFLDNAGNYIPTHTGDKFKILSTRSINTSNQEEVQRYLQAYEGEDIIRKNYREPVVSPVDNDTQTNNPSDRRQNVPRQGPRQRISGQDIERVAAQVLTEGNLRAGQNAIPSIESMGHRRSIVEVALQVARESSEGKTTITKSNGEEYRPKHCWDWASQIYERAGMPIINERWKGRIQTRFRYTKTYRNGNPNIKNDGTPGGPGQTYATRQEILNIKPGDWLAYNNGNRSSTGNHSAIFLGWRNEGRVAIVASGSADRPWRVHDVNFNTRPLISAGYAPVRG
jgi:hypothetical protein